MIKQKERLLERVRSGQITSVVFLEGGDIKPSSRLRIFQQGMREKSDVPYKNVGKKATGEK